MKTLDVKKLCVLTGSILLVGTTGLTSAFADRPQNPYEAIPGRNVFRLVAPPPVEPPTPPVVIPPNLKIQAITTILGTKQVLLLVEAKPPQQPKPESLVLNEKQRHGDIEVLSIDELAGLVELNYHGSRITLDITKDAFKPTGGPAIIPVAGMPQPPWSRTPVIPPPAAATAPAQAKPLSHEEQIVLMETQRELHKGNPNVISFWG